jgi:ATP-dependent DNA ligase
VRASLFLSIADALKALCRGSTWIDAEIVVEDASGLSSFNDLQADLNTGRPDRFRDVVLDVLYCEGFDLTIRHLKMAERHIVSTARKRGLPSATR